MLSRRKFVGASLAVIIAQNAWMAKPVEAWTHGAALAAATGKSLLSGFDYNEGFNSFMFINVIKSLGDPGNNANMNIAAAVTDDGYPKDGTLSDQWFQYVTLPLDQSTTWVLDWSGGGGISLANGTLTGSTNFVVTAVNAGLVNGSATPATYTNGITVTGTNASIEFTNGSGANQFTVSFPSTVTFSSFTNLRLYRKSDQTALNAGEIFTPEFVSKVTTLNPRILRTMDFTHTNNNNQALWTSRAKTTNLTYLGGKFMQSLYGGIASGTNAYAVSAPSSWPGLVHGATVQCAISNANTAASTLSVGGTAAKPILDLGGSAISAASIITANCLATFVYDSMLDGYIMNVSNPSNSQSGGYLTAWAPIEIVVALANKCNKDLWWNFPGLADLTFVTNHISYIASNLKATLHLYVEPLNEIWNTGVFYQSQYGLNYSQKLGIPAASGRRENAFAGLKISQFFPSVKSTWTGAGRSAASLHRVCPVWGPSASPTTVQLYELNGGDLKNNAVDTTTVTVNIAASTVAWPFNGFSETWPVVLTTTGALPTGITAGTTYYIKNSSGNNTSGATFQLSATPGGAAITLSGTQSGTHTATYTNPFYVSIINQAYNVGSPTFSRPIDQCEVISPAMYFEGYVVNQGGTYAGTATDQQLCKDAADAYNAGNTTLAFKWMDQDIRRGMGSALSFTVASNVFTGTAAPPGNNTPVCFYTTGTAMTGLDYTQVYFIINSGVGGANSFQVSATYGGTAVTGISGGVGTQYYGYLNGQSLGWLETFHMAKTNSLNFGWAQVAASYNGARPGGASNLEYICYEGGLQCVIGGSGLGAPYDSTFPGGVLTLGRVALMLEAYKNSSYGYQLALDYCNDFVSIAAVQGVTVARPAWFTLTGTKSGGTAGTANNNQQWALVPGDSLTTPYQTYFGVEAFNNS